MNFLRVHLNKADPTQYCCLLVAKRPQVRVQIPKQIVAYNLLEIKSLGYGSRQVSLPGIDSRAGGGMLTSWEPLTGGSPSRLRHGNLPGTGSLGMLRQVDVLGDPRELELGFPKISSITHAGKDEGL